MEEEIFLVACPNCGREHEQKANGVWCNMACFYQKLRRDSNVG